MKKFFLNWKTIMVAAILSAGFASCSGSDEEDGLINTQNVSVQDPEGTVVINMGSGASDNFYDIGLEAKIHIDENFNFGSEILTKNEYYYSGPYGGGGYSDHKYHVEFASIGKVNGLGQVTSAPTSGWSQSIVVIPGTGYVARMMKDGKSYGKFTRLYVVEQNAGEILTYTTVKCQTPFDPPFTLEKTSVELSHVLTSSYNSASGNYESYYTGTSANVTIYNGTNAIKVAEKPNWCSVSVYTDYVYISADKNPNPQPRTGTIVLKKNSACSVSITVTQDSAPAE